jgi:hypothetical protein
MYGESDFNAAMHLPLVKGEFVGDNLEVKQVAKSFYCVFSMYWRIVALSVSTLETPLRRLALRWLRRTRPFLLNPSLPWAKDLCIPLFHLYARTPSVAQQKSVYKCFAKAPAGVRLSMADVANAYLFDLVEEGDAINSFKSFGFLGPLHVMLVASPSHCAVSESLTPGPADMIPQDGSFRVQTGLFCPPYRIASLIANVVSPYSWRVNFGKPIEPAARSNATFLSDALMLPPVFQTSTEWKDDPWGRFSSDTVDCVLDRDIDYGGYGHVGVRVYVNACHASDWQTQYSSGRVGCPFYVVVCNPDNNFLCAKVSAEEESHEPTTTEPAATHSSCSYSARLWFPPASREGYVPLSDFAALDVGAAEHDSRVSDRIVDIIDGGDVYDMSTDSST